MTLSLGISGTITSSASCACLALLVVIILIGIDLLEASWTLKQMHVYMHLCYSKRDSQ